MRAKLRRASAPGLGRWLTAAALGLALALGHIEAGLAHAHVIASSPAPDAVLEKSPATLTLTFDSLLADSGNLVNLYRSDRTQVGSFPLHAGPGKQPQAQVELPSLTPDVYTVGWTSVSGEDGHTLSQFYAFTIGGVPAATAAAGPTNLQVGDTRVALSATRADVGPMTLHATVRDAGGKPLTNLQRVIFRYQAAGLNLGADEIVAPASGSDAQTPAFTLGLVGAWQFQVIVRRAGLDDVSATTQLNLSAAPGVPAPTAAPATATPASASPTAAATAQAEAASTSNATVTAVAPTTTSVVTPAATPAVAGTPTLAAPTSVVATATASNGSPSPALTPAVPAKLPSSPDSSILIPVAVGIVLAVTVVGFVVRRLAR